MDPERWKQIDSLLAMALERPAVEREAFLRQSCGGDAELEREVLSLLSSRQKAERFLESPAIEVAAQALAQHQKTGSPDAMDLATGHTVSHYRIQRKLGGGGMGVVYQAEDTRLQRPVALKFLSGELARDPAARNRFLREARAASLLNHPNIITVYDIGTAGSDGRTIDFIAMEFVRGSALDELISPNGLPLADLLRYATQIADALAAAHAAGIVHRDLKPANLMVSGSGSVKVLDFGLAKIAAQGGGIETDQGLIRGTVSYMSPEQAEGKKVDARSDIFSFGAVLYEMIAGAPAFGGDSVASILSAILRDDPAPPSGIRPGIPRELDDIISRCLQKDPGRRYQHAGDLKIDLVRALERLGSNEPAGAVRAAGWRTGWRWFAAMAACAGASFALAWRIFAPQPSLLATRLTAITNDPGYSGISAISPDGKMVAYCSDRGLEDGLDLYVKQVSGGQPVRLTFDGAGNVAPDFSPDGGKIVFRSNRNGGGIYEMPAFGGEARLLARDGRDPKYSPDGSQVAYWVGAGRVNSAVPGSAAVWVVPVGGGQPHQVVSYLTSARHPIWSPDGKNLLFTGYASLKAQDPANLDWWLVTPDGKKVTQTGFYRAIAQAGLHLRSFTGGSQGEPDPGCWAADRGTVLFSQSPDDARNLWEIGISAETGKVNGALRRVTTASGAEVEPSCGAAGALAFTRIEVRRDIWSLPYDLDRGAAQGALEEIAQGPTNRIDPSLSGNGRFLAFNLNPSGNGNIWMKDLAGGRESLVAGSSLAQRYPLVNGSGSRVAYSLYERDRRVVYATMPGGTAEKLCDVCLRATDWSRDEKSLLIFSGDPYQIDVLDMESRRQTSLLKHASYPLLYGRYSPDQRWVSFTARIQPNLGHIVIAPLDGAKPVPESSWIQIAEVRIDDLANWSPDGKTIYFTSGKDGFNCIWGQRLDSSSHRPAGEPFAAVHLHGRKLFENRGWSAAAGRIAIALTESTGNIWMMSRGAAF